MLVLMGIPKRHGMFRKKSCPYLSCGQEIELDLQGQREMHSRHLTHGWSASAHMHRVETSGGVAGGEGLP